MHTHINIILILTRRLVRACFPLQQLLKIVVRHPALAASTQLLISLEHFLIMLLIFFIITALTIVVLIVLLRIIRVKGFLEPLSWKQFIFNDQRGIIEGILLLTVRIYTSIHGRLAFEVINEGTEILFILRVLEE